MSLRQGAAAAANIELHGRGGATKPSQGVGGHAATPRHVGRTLATSLEKREESGHPWVGVPLLPPPSTPVPVTGHRRRDTRATGRYGPADKSCFTSFMRPCRAAPPWQSQTRTCLRAGIAVA